MPVFLTERGERGIEKEGKRECESEEGKKRKIDER